MNPAPQTLELEQLYIQEQGIIKAKIRAEFPGIIFKESGPLIMADISRDALEEIREALEAQKLNFIFKKK